MKRTEQERIDGHLRRSKRAGLPATLTLTEWEQTIADFNGLCAYCQQQSFEVLEHFLPAEMAGTHVGNCVPACAVCNLRKSGHTGSILITLFGQATIDRIQAYLTVRTTNKALQIFSYEGSELRTIVDKEGELWWVAADVCEILGLSNVSQAVNGNEKAGDPGLDEDEKLTSAIYISGQNRSVLFVNEPGLYSLIFKSRKPEAKAFKRWVTHEVLPAIRKTGSYAIKQELPLQGYDDLMVIVADKEKRRQLIKALQKIDRGYQDLEDTLHSQPPVPPKPRQQATAHQAPDQQQAVTPLLDEQDHVGKWLEECFTLDVDAWTSNEVIHDSYKRWCENNNVLSKDAKRLALSLKLKGCNPGEVKKIGGKVSRGVRGLK